MFVKIDNTKVEDKLTPEEIKTVENFMDRMVKKLLVNSHKGGWKAIDQSGKRTWDIADDSFLFKKFHEETGEFMEAYVNDTHPEMLDEAADTANLLMMLSDPERLKNR
jgi:hypothetical protein